MEIWLVRHGETSLNAARILQPAGTPLSARGLRQANALAERMAAEPITGILSSDLPRAQQTALAIASRTGHPIRTSVLLHERSFGDWRGLPYERLGAAPLAMIDAPPGGESAAQFIERCRQAFDYTLQWQRTLGGRDPRPSDSPDAYGLAAGGGLNLGVAAHGQHRIEYFRRLAAAYVAFAKLCEASRCWVD
jgi:hypothetical protein